jgi:hypothetical protein
MSRIRVVRSSPPANPAGTAVSDQERPTVELLGFAILGKKSAA